jgi:hypothetical protein
MSIADIRSAQQQDKGMIWNAKSGRRGKFCCRSVRYHNGGTVAADGVVWRSVLRRSIQFLHFKFS